MEPAAAWTAGVVSLANAGLAIAVLLPLRKARRSGALGSSVVAARAGFTIEVALGLYSLAALFRGSLGVAAGLGAANALATVSNWGMISGSGTVLIILAGARWYLTPLLEAVARSERALTVMLGTLESENLDVQSLDLSAREQEVLAVIASGKVSDQEIADTLFISTATAATHVRNILKKPGLHDRRQLVLIGLHESGG